MLTTEVVVLFRNVFYWVKILNCLYLVSMLSILLCLK